MKYNIITIALLLAITSVSAQKTNSTSKQERTIEINNDNGALSITFDEGEIVQFTINETVVAKDQYHSYQEIIDDFSNEKKRKKAKSNSANYENGNGEKLNAMIIEYLMDEDIINSVTRYEVELRRKYLKVNGQKTSNLIHHECLDFFADIYGHRLNFDSEINFKKSGKNTTSSISIVDKK